MDYSYYTGLEHIQQIRAGAEAYPFLSSQVMTETGYQDAPPDDV